MLPTVEVWLASPDAAASLDPAALDGPDRVEWETIHSERRRRDWASSRALLRAVQFPPGHNRSLSHSHGFAALSHAPTPVAVGVDVEWLSPRDYSGMARVAFSEAEADGLTSLQRSSDGCAAFYELWTLKEAFAKALQLPFLDALRCCCFGVTAGEAAAIVPTALPWQATVFAPRPRLRLAVVRVAPSLAALAGLVKTMEWPPARDADWPVVRSLGSSGGSNPVA